jgi:SHS2 domain-containing protein
MRSGFSIIEHPADVGIEAYGASVAEAFQNAARGLFSLIVNPSTVAAAESRTVELRAADREQLLVKWLTELLYLYDGLQFVPKEFAVALLDGGALRATVRGEALSHRHQMLMDVKAVTYHQLAVREDADGAVITVILDI